MGLTIGSLRDMNYAETTRVVDFVYDDVLSRRGRLFPPTTHVVPSGVYRASACLGVIIDFEVMITWDILGGP